MHRLLCPGKRLLQKDHRFLADLSKMVYMCTFKVLTKKVYISRTGQPYLEVSQSDSISLKYSQEKVCN